MKQLALAAALVVAPLATVPIAWTPAGAAEAPPSFADMAAEKLPTVVGIQSTREVPQPESGLPQLPPGFRDFFGMPFPGPREAPPGSRPMQAQGSGFIISPDGYVVTNNHVVEGADEIEVVLQDQRELSAELVGADPATDVALLKVEGAEDLPSVTWGNSDDMRVGDWVVAIGNPFGLGGTVTAGIVSARSRNIQVGPYDDFLQTDASINRGNSGGPLFDANGAVVGVNAAIFSPSGGNIGIGFAIPAKVAKAVVDELRETGTVRRGWLGVQIQPVDETMAEALGLDEASGALVAEVTEGGPADEAGIRQGDVIVRLADDKITSTRDLTVGVASLEAGQTAEIGLLRGGRPSRVEVEIGIRPSEKQASARQPTQEPPQEGFSQLGLSVAPLSDEVRQGLGLGDGMSGVVVAEVQSGSPAESVGVQAGDVIVEAGNQPVASVAEIRRKANAAAREGKPLLLRMFRNDSFAFVAVPLKTG